MGLYLVTLLSKWGVWRNWKTWALIAALIAISLAAWTIHGWKQDSERLDAVLAEKQADEAAAEQSRAMDADLDNALTNYRSKTRELDKQPKDSTVIPAGSLQRLRARIESAGGGA